MSNLQALLQQLSELSNLFESLGTRLSLAAGELKNLGTPPSPNLLEELQRYRDTFDRVRDRALTLARESGAEAGAIPTNLISVRELESFVKSLSPVGDPKAVQQQALSLLDRILGIAVIGDPPLPALANCQNQARQIRHSIASAPVAALPQVAISLAQHSHPFCDLLDLVDLHDNLDDERWARLQDSVSHAFDRSLAVAAVRSRLQVPPPGISRSATVPTPSRPVAATPALAMSTPPTGSSKSLGLSILVHIQGTGDRQFRENEPAGTQGESKALEGLQIALSPPVSGLSLRYMGHLQNSGDTPWVPSGQYVGTRGQGRRMEGFAIELVGPNASQYDIFYVGHFSNYGDSRPVANGEFCGVRGQGLQLESIKVWVEPKRL